MPRLRFFHQWAVLCLLLGSGSTQVFFAQNLNADLSIQTQVRPLDYQSPLINLGVMNFRIASDVFADASPQSPVYLRVSLGEKIALTRSLTHDLNGDPPFQPIYLPLALMSADQQAVLQAPPDAVALVRLIAGESAFWIRVSASSSNWVRRNDQTEPPSRDHQVQFVLGQGAPVMRDYLQGRYGRQAATLLFPTVNPFSASTEHARSLFLFTDLSQAGLRVGSDQTDFSVIASAVLLDDTTTGVTSAVFPENIQWGEPLDAVIDPPAVAMARMSIPKQGCDVPVHFDDVPLQTSCDGTQSDAGFQRLERSFELEFLCGGRGVEGGTRISMDFRGPGRLKVPVQVDEQGEPVSTDAGLGLPADTVWIEPGAIEGPEPFSRAYAFRRRVYREHGRWVAVLVQVQYQGHEPLENTRAAFTARPITLYQDSFEQSFDVDVLVANRMIPSQQHPEFPARHQAATPDQVNTREAKSRLDAFWQVRACDVLFFPDPVLRELLLRDYDLNEDQQLQHEEGRGIRTLSLADPRLRDLKGIERLVGLRELTVRSVLRDYRPVTFAKDLVKLDLRHCGITDLSDFLHLSTWFGAAGSDELLLSHNNIRFTETQCDVVRELQRRFTVGTLVFGTQLDPEFAAAAAAWRGGTLLELVGSYEHGLDLAQRCAEAQSGEVP